MSQKKKALPPEVFGMQPLSWEEYHVAHWCQELLVAGAISSWSHEPETFPLSEPETAPWEEKLKTKTKYRTQSVLRGHVYTPDFKLILHPDSPPVFRAVKEGGPGRHDGLWVSVSDDGRHSVYLEVKGCLTTRLSEGKQREATLNQKWLWEKHRVLTNLSKVGTKKGGFFGKTFTPRRYLQTDKTRRARKLHYQPRTLEEWLA